MKRRDFLRSTGTLAAVAAAAPGFAFDSLAKKEPELLIVFGSAKAEDMKQLFTSMAKTGFDYLSITPPGSHYEALYNIVKTSGLKSWFIGRQKLSANGLKKAAAFEKSITNISIEDDIASLEAAFVYGKSTGVYLHSMDVAHHSFKAYEERLGYLSGIIYSRRGDFQGKIQVCTAMGRNSYANSLQGFDHCTTDPETGKLVKFQV